MNVLFRGGAKINSINMFGKTPLHIMADKGEEMLKKIRKANKPPFAGHRTIVEALIKHFYARAEK